MRPAAQVATTDVTDAAVSTGDVAAATGVGAVAVFLTAAVGGLFWGAIGGAIVNAVSSGKRGRSRHRR